MRAKAESHIHCAQVHGLLDDPGVVLEIPLFPGNGLKERLYATQSAGTAPTGFGKSDDVRKNALAHIHGRRHRCDLYLGALRKSKKRLFFRGTRKRPEFGRLFSRNRQLAMGMRF